MGTKRFEVIESQGTAKAIYIIKDNETGMKYLFAKFGNAGGLCPLIDKNGKVVISSED